MNGVNLIPAHRLDAQKRLRRQRAWLVGCAIYGTALAGACGLGRAAWCGDNGALAAELTKTTLQAGELQHALTVLQPKLAIAEKKLGTIRLVANKPDWSLLLTLLAATVGDEVMLRSCQLAPLEPPAPDPAKPASASAPPHERYKLDLDGLGRSQVSVSQFVLRLQQTELFEEIKLLKTNREPLGDGQAIAFQVHATLMEHRKR